MIFELSKTVLEYYPFSESFVLNPKFEAMPLFDGYCF